MPIVIEQGSGMTSCPALKISVYGEQDADKVREAIAELLRGEPNKKTEEVLANGPEK